MPWELEVFGSLHFSLSFPQGTHPLTKHFLCPYDYLYSWCGTNSHRRCFAATAAGAVVEGSGWVWGWRNGCRVMSSCLPKVVGLKTAKSIFPDYYIYGFFFSFFLTKCNSAFFFFSLLIFSVTFSSQTIYYGTALSLWSRKLDCTVLSHLVSTENL